MAVTIKDIASKVGMSVSTVSKALNNKNDISEAVKERIRTIANEIGYKKNILASRLVTMKSNTLGVFIFSRSKIKNTESSAFTYLNAMLDEARKRGYDIVLFSIESTFSQTKSYIDLCLERQVEGAIFIGFENGDPHLEELTNSELPIILMEKVVQGENVSSVTTDNARGIQLGLNYLLELGHKKIAFIKGHPGAEVSHVRFNTYKEMMQEINCYDESLLYEGDYSLDSGYKLGKEIAGLSHWPTAILAANDLMAIGLLRGLYERKVKVPDEISVVGFDNFEMGKFVRPPLTTIAQDFVEMANLAVKTLLDMITDHSQGRIISLEPELIVRESCRRNRELR